MLMDKWIPLIEVVVCRGKDGLMIVLIVRVFTSCSGGNCRPMLAGGWCCKDGGF
jgi:hypothetical protein